ncbi:hypothetical protein CDL12_14433 [Handroanthus impetiginosus]|uniref:Late embryogenesis abundant protein LEA-2 subgroup domain-containing protein n=1 Tax=Handroanthus impetiginosus TaxID=429701 RepID=A0A2G9H653_9LAMI|nr:hypothetical protein CDL12_14433 [Handroanthus impetiginosus]
MGGKYHRSSHGGDACCCCNIFSCFLDCLCTCICQIICTILIIAAIVIFILWLIFRPKNIDFYATNASLTEFNLEGNTLHYNLDLNFTIRNPNERIGVQYDRIEAITFYQGQRFAAQQLAPFYQEQNSTDTVSAEFKGQNIITLGGDQLSNYNDEKGSGKFGIDVKLYLRIKLKFGLLESSTTVNPTIDCDIKIPLTTNGIARVKYEEQKCHYGWR